MFPRKDSTAVRFLRTSPSHTPIRPSTIELVMWPNPHRIVITVVLIHDHFLAQDIITNGR
jgi:hypothetical protein